MKTLMGIAWGTWSLVVAGTAIPQAVAAFEARDAKHTAVSSDGMGLEEASVAEALTAAARTAPFAGSNRVTAEALVAEGVDIFASESASQFRRLASLPVPRRESAFGESATEVIIGWDTRERMYTTVYPASAKVLITFDTGRCSGTMISPDTVATAGHCVHTGAGGTWHSGITVYPGRDGTQSPYGSCAAIRLYSVIGWTVSGSELYDYGAIKLNCTVGNLAGWYGLTSASPGGLPSIIQGYPGDKPLEQWGSADKVRTTTTRQVFYLNDTFGGMSGSAVWYERNGNGPYMIGIHAYGKHGSGAHFTYNHGTRITSAVFNNLVNWINSP
jgi:glutamyl endopeptidase